MPSVRRGNAPGLRFAHYMAPVMVNETVHRRSLISREKPLMIRENVRVTLRMMGPAPRRYSASSMTGRQSEHPRFPAGAGGQCGKIALLNHWTADFSGPYCRKMAAV